jgi:hypothetical protein
MYILLFVCSPGLLFGQEYHGFNSGARKPLIDVRVKKTGPYIGWQQGKYAALEFGGERQWKQIKLRDPITHAAHMGFNYNFRQNVLGFDIGYWVKPHRLSLTYGANLFLRTDFDRNKVGLAPVLGFKFWILHLQSGYQIMSAPKEINTNTFFISLRIGIINDRQVEWNRDKKKKKRK